MSPTLIATRLRVALRSMGELLDDVTWGPNFPRKPYDQEKRADAVVAARLMDHRR